MLESLPDQVDSVWYHPRASRESANARGATAPDGGEEGVSLRGRREDARRAELVLSAGGPTGSLRIAARSEDADAQPDSRVDICGPGSDPRRDRRHLQFPQSRREGGPGGAAMTGVPSSTWFSAAPHWEWFIVLYFFLGGLAGGSYFLSVLAALAEDGRIRWSGLRRLRAPSPVGRIIAVLGGFFGFYVAGYTGVLLAVTNRPIWSDTPLLGLLFIVSAASTSCALMILLAYRSGRATPGVADLHRMDDWVIALELLVLIALLLSLGRVLSAWLNLWGVLLAVVIVLGMIAPLALSWRARRSHQEAILTPAILILLGGFLLRVVIVFSAESV